ncbi:MAG TPA: hypothetical protein VK206_07195 [Anaerolineales bacterium]|nr:hypothetical protein [Anaerolineales bacterium]
MKNKLMILAIAFLLIISTAACAAQKSSLSVSNLRTSRDRDGKNAISTFSPSDVIYAVTDLANAPRGTKLEVRWIAVKAAGTESNKQFDAQTFNVTDELFTGTTFFQLSNAAPWPTGQYRVDLYLNDALADSAEFNVQ